MLVEKKVVILDRRDSVKDNSEVVTAIYENNVIELFCQGTLKNSSKNSLSLNPGDLSSVEFFISSSESKMSKLKTSKLVSRYEWTNTKLQYFLKYLTRLKGEKVNSNVYSILEKIIVDNIKFENQIELTLYFQLFSSFVKMDLNSCSNCKTKLEISSFSFEKGFLCREHQKDNPNLTKNKLMIIYYLFNYSFERMISLDIEYSFYKDLLESVKEYLNILFGI